jgi:RNA polymerase sigma-70 factor, ECF subfamily
LTNRNQTTDNTDSADKDAEFIFIRAIRVIRGLIFLDKFRRSAALPFQTEDDRMAAADGDPLLAQLVAGREEAFAALYDLHGAALYRVAFTLLGSRESAEDAVQEVFASLVRSRHQLAGVENLRAYLFASLRHAAARLAAIRKMEPLVGDVAAQEPRSLDAAQAAKLERALASLPAEQREILALKIDGELTFAEIAALLGISANTAASRYRYALEKLRAALGEKHV